MTITIHPNMEQGSEEWLAARTGLLTASELKLILTPTLKIASNDKERKHLYELLAQRITDFTEPQYIGDAMLRGYEDEITARDLYSEKIAQVEEVGFITNDKWGFKLGYSPDGVVGADGLIECKSRIQRYQAETMIVHVPDQTIPDEYALQCQTGLLITERKWLDFISYSGGMPMIVIRVFPDDVVQAAILAAAAGFEQRLADARKIYDDALASDARLFATTRKIEGDIII